MKINLNSVLYNPLYSNLCTFLCTTAQQFVCNNTTIFMHQNLHNNFSVTFCTTSHCTATQQFVYSTLYTLCTTIWTQ